ncbi:hypothetical protein HDU98_002214, partial [Podochytrium sp. JEL0797]
MAALFFNNIPLSLYVVTNFLNGLTGGMSLLALSASAYIADTTEPMHRTQYFLMMDGSFAIAMAAGPFLGGFITKYFGFATVFATEFGLAAILLCYLIFLFPDSESAPTTRVKKTLPVVFSESIVSSTITLRAVLKFGTAFALIAIVTLQSLAMSGAQIMFLLYPAKIFGWSSYEIGQFIFTSSVQKIAWLTVLLPALLSFAKSRGFDKIACEIWALRFGLFMACLSEVSYGLATTQRAFVMTTALSSLSSFASPTIKSLLSTLVPPSHQGRLFSSIKIFEAVALLFATVVVNGIYRATVDTAPNTIFFVMASLMGLAFLLSIGWVSKRGIAEMELGGVTDIVDVNGEGENGVRALVRVEDEATPLL